MPPTTEPTAIPMILPLLFPPAASAPAVEEEEVEEAGAVGGMVVDPVEVYSDPAEFVEVKVKLDTREVGCDDECDPVEVGTTTTLECVVMVCPPTVLV